MRRIHVGRAGCFISLVIACSSPSEPGQGTDTDGGSSTTSTTADPTTGGGGQSNTSAGDTSNGESGSETTAASDDTAGESTGPVDGSNGANCDSGETCDSGFCHPIPVMGGGRCSECELDTDCDGGTCSLDVEVGYAVCTDGSLGMMCDSTEGCAEDLVCETLIETFGLVDTKFCSECNAITAPCGLSEICSPVYNEDSLSGYKHCVEPDSVPNNEGCPLTPIVGDSACANDHCVAVSSEQFPLIQIGLCGECSTDGDCPEETPTCVEGGADLEMGVLVGTTCQ